MNVVTSVAQSIPDGLRRRLYYVLAFAVIIVASCEILDINNLFGIDLSKWEELLNYYAGIMGVVAAGNVGPQTTGKHAKGVDEA